MLVLLRKLKMKIIPVVRRLLGKPVLKLNKTKISRIVREYGDTWSYYVEPIGQGEPFKAGQFIHLMAPGGEVSHKFVRHMSVASLPTETELLFSMDLSSGTPYKTLFKKAKVGTEVLYFALAGSFTLEGVAPGSHIVFIAGGIGITPMRCLIRDIESNKRDIRWELFHVGREYLYKDDFQIYSDRYRQLGRDGVEAMLDEAASRGGQTWYFISGSHSFVEDLSAGLQKRGIAEERIKLEDFSH